MFDKIADEMNYQDFLNLVTQFYCSLSIRKQMQNIAYEIREFILMRKDVINKELLAKKILDFFLRIQSQLQDKSDKGWDQAFQIQVSRVHALVKICDFTLLNTYRYALNKLKIQKKKTTQPAQLSFLSNTQQLISNCNIEVEKDIKIKTYYFFKWCQYIQQSKAIKEMKQREVDNQKISISFSKYGLKSNSFNAWKIYYKKIKNQKLKATTIANKCKQKLLKSSLMAIQETSDIIAVQASLRKKIQHTIVSCKKKSLFKKLRLNQQIIKKQTKQKSFNNKYAHQFLNHFLSGLKPRMNKSFQVARNKLVKQNQKLLLIKYFKQVQKLCQDVRSKISMINFTRKTAYFNYWRSDQNDRINFKDKCQKFQNCLSFRRRRVAITLLSFNRLLRKQQFKKIQTIMQNNQNALTHRSFIQVNTKKCIQDKKVKTIQSKIIKQKLILFSQLKRNHRHLQKEKAYIKLVKNVILRRLLSRYSSFKLKRQQKQLIYDELKLKSQKSRQMQAFRKWRRLKFYHKYEESSLLSIMKYNKKVIMISFWNKFLNRAEQKSHIQKFVSATRLAIIKLAYVKILGRSYYINEKIRKMKQQKNKKLKLNLFNLLLQNQSYNQQRSKLILKNFTKRCEKNLICKLKQAVEQKKQLKKIQGSLQFNKKRLFFSKLIDQNKENNVIFNKSSKVSKKIFIQYFKRSIQTNFTVTQRNKCKGKLLQNKLRHILISKFISQLKESNNIKQVEQQKQNKILFKLVKKQVLKIKEYLSQRKQFKRIKESQQTVMKNRKQDSLNIILQGYKTNNVIAVLNHSRKQNVLTDILKLAHEKCSNRKNMLKLSQIQFKTNANQFVRLLQLQKREADDKIKNLYQARQTSERKKLGCFINLLKENKQNIQNERKINITRKSALFSQYIAMNLRKKFSRIKFNCSLKLYAKNLMKKALKGLKSSHIKLKQKQNLIRLDKTSSIIMQKSIQRSFKSHTLSQQIQKFNLRKSRQMR